MRSRILITLCVLSIASTGCTASRYSAPVPAQYAAAERDRMLRMLDIYPGDFRLSQHIVMKANGKEYDFIGYLAVKKNMGFRALAFGEMGGKLFDFIERDGKREIVTKPEGMPSNPLLDGVMGDIRHLFDAGQFEDAYTDEKEDKKVSLVVKHKDGVSEYIFSNSSGNLSTSTEAVKAKPVREANYSDYMIFPGWERPLPSRITVFNRRWHYELRIELLKIDTTPIDKRMLFNSDKE